MKKAKRLVSTILTAVILLSMIPLSTLTTSAVSVYSVGTWAELYNALIAENDATIELTANVEFESSFSYSTVNIKGDKILNLNSYSITYSYKNNQVDPYMEYSNRSVMFYIPSDASLTINDDADNKGRIFFDAYMVNPYDFTMCAIRDIFTVRGKLIVNGGTIEAGRSKEQYVTALVNNGSLYTGYLWQQIYGTAITLYDYGQLIVNGGNIAGRGGPMILDHDKNQYYSGCAVRMHDNCKVTINGGEFDGYGGAPIFYDNNYAEFIINAGTFETSGLSAMLYNIDNIAVCKATKAVLKIPDNAWMPNQKYLRIKTEGSVYDFGEDKSNLDLYSTDSYTVIESINLGFKWLSPNADVTEKVTDLGTVHLGTSQMNMTFAFEAKPLVQKYINEGYSVYGVSAILEGYNGIYYDPNGGDIRFNEVINSEGNYKVYQTLELYKNGSYIAEYSHYFTVKVVEPEFINKLEAIVTSPKEGNYGTNAYTLDTSYKVISTEWYEVTGSGSYDISLMEPYERFETGKTYECCVTFAPKDGYAFINNIKGTINGEFYDYGYRTWNEATISARFTVEKSEILGDVNNDGYLNISDATHIQKHLANLIEFDDKQLKKADINGDKYVNILDATQIQKICADIVN